MVEHRKITGGVTPDQVQDFTIGDQAITLDREGNWLRSVARRVRPLKHGIAGGNVWRSAQEANLVSTSAISSAPLNDWELAAKRAFDITAASLALFFIAPLLLFVMGWIKIDSPGPILFLQSRRGLGGCTFRILKFRSMHVLEDGDVVAQARRGDQRVTKAGYWLRRLSIDEIPQLINVLRGEMSLVGPRPHALAHDEHYGVLINGYTLRYHVKPGITGLAQASGFRGETPTLDSMQKRVDLDLLYIMNWTIWLDIRIILYTMKSLLNSKNVY